MLIKTKPIPRRKLIASLFYGASILSSGLLAASFAPSSAQAQSNIGVSTALDTMKPLQGTTPNTNLEGKGGVSKPLAEWIDRPMLINFWASWCPPCVHELPALQTLDRALDDHGMAVMLVGVDRKGRPFAEEFLQDRGITIPRSLHEKTGALARALEIKVMPTSLLVRGNGELIGKIEGPLEWDKPDVIEAVIATLTP